MTVNLRDIRSAHDRIAPYIHHTPVMESTSLNQLVGASILFKCEHLQKTGAFKSRGAVNAVFSLAAGEAATGVATHSSGNHGSALARAAHLRGIPAWIVVPRNARAVKKDAIRAWGAEIIECEPTLAARETALARVVERTGASFIPPYDDDRIIAGQGTAALELMDEVPGLDSIVVPVGGGGLLAGTAIAANRVECDRPAVYGAEPQTADDAARSFRSGVRVTTHVPETIADGLLTTLGERNFAVIKDCVEDILLVSEADIVDAMKLIWTRLKQVIEPSSAVAFAAVLAHARTFAGGRVGVVLTGGNVDIGDLPFRTAGASGVLPD